MTDPTLTIRPAAAGDAAQIVDIYSYFVENSVSTFEETIPSEREMIRRMETVQSAGLPYLVALMDGDVAGYAYAAPFRTRRAFRYTVEDSIYIRNGLAGRGIGRGLLKEVIAHCEAIGIRQMVAVISNTENGGSVQLHQRCGFQHAGTLPATGYKFNRWIDTVFMQLAIGDGNGTPPEGPGNGT